MLNGQAPDESVLEPAALDAWLRAQLGRRLAVTGITLMLPAGTSPAPPGAVAAAGAPPAALRDALGQYGEIWLRWLPSGTRLDEAAIRAAAGDADVLLVWLDPTGAPGAPVGWPERPLTALHDALANLSLRDDCVLAIGGVGASRSLARRLGYDDGFAVEAPAVIATTLAREALALAAVRGGGSSPPCYL